MPFDEGVGSEEIAWPHRPADVDPYQATGSVRADWTSAWQLWVHNQVNLDTKAKAKELERSSYIDGRL